MEYTAVVASRPEANGPPSRPRNPVQRFPRPMTGILGLKNLRERPFELLKEIERLSRAAQSGQERESGSGREWVGVAFRLGAENFLVAREETREVMGLP